MNFPAQLRWYQVQVFGDILNGIDHAPGGTMTVMFPRQAGKNEVSAAIVSFLLIANADRGGSIVVCAPTLYPQASLSLERTVSRLRPMAKRLGLPFRLEGNVIHCGRATATFLSGSPSANVAGHTASLLLIGDEAQDIEADWFNRQFRPMTASTGASTLMFGTPWENNSLLERATAANRARDDSQRAQIYRRAWPSHHQVDWREVAEVVPPYGRYVEQERARLGAEHPIFRSQYELVAGQSERRLLSATQLAALLGSFGPLESPLAGERYAGGLDFAGEGANGDATVLTVARVLDKRCEVVAAFRWRGEPFESLGAAVVQLARRWRLERLLCDATGMGAPLTARLAESLGRTVEPFVFTQPEKSALAFELLAAANVGSLAIAPPSTTGLRALWDELAACQSELRPGGQLSWGAPAGSHDDCVASLTLALRASRSLGPARVATGRNRFARAGAA